VHCVAAPVASLVTVSTVPKGRVGLAHVPSAASGYQVASPASRFVGAGGAGGAAGAVVVVVGVGGGSGGAAETACAAWVVVVGGVVVVVVDGAGGVVVVVGCGAWYAARCEGRFTPSRCDGEDAADF
jgi:hypothetical protein